MSTNLRDIANTQMRFDEDILAQLGVRRSALQKQQKQASRVLALTQANLDTIQEELGIITRRYHELNDAVRARHAAARRCYMSNLLEELLRHIFLVLVREPDPIWSIGAINTTRSRQPFQLAAVSKWWRTVSLKIPELWCYIAIPPPMSCASGREMFYKFWIQTTLKRSKDHPIDILLPWKANVPFEKCRYSQPLLVILARHAPRWRNVQIMLPPLSKLDDIMLALKYPTPCLRELVVSASPDKIDESVSRALAGGMDPSQPRLLPNCKLLRKLVSSFTNIIPTVGEGTGSSRLEELSLVAQIPPRRMWAILCRSPQLQRLTIDVISPWPTNENLIPDEDVHLERLVFLEVFSQYAAQMFAVAAGKVATPNLTHLSTQASDSVFTEFQPFLELRCANVTRMSLRGDPSMNMIVGLSHLRRLETLRLTDAKIMDDFFDALGTMMPVSSNNTVSEWVLPNLTSLEFSKVKFLPEGYGLAHYLTARNTFNPSVSSNVRSPTTIAVVTFEDCPSTPSWLLAEVRILLGQELEFEQEVASTIGSREDLNDLMTEAEFTDGETDSSEEETEEDEATGDDSDANDSSYVPSSSEEDENENEE
ncbi:hypothetical protein BKA62DRAFT_489649 [Auriculariales sp. MPI-PUGE-AT-0066]|nr:hypothetical protein BKA62DRAFT_489649 [Auriculariales sp. MPI-PUGE-AT-0066]